MIRTYPFRFQVTALWSVLLMLVFTSCKRDVDNPLAPEPTTVLISGKTYQTGKIGSQVWTVVNYDGPGGMPYGSGKEKPEYGHYYTFDEVKAIQLPAGWRLPTQQDYVTLAESQGIVFTAGRAMRQEAIKKLISTTNWQSIPGTNASGFNAYPAGYSYQNNAPTDGYMSEFWTAEGSTFSIQESASNQAHSILFYGNDDTGYRFNVRFIKDE